MSREATVPPVFAIRPALGRSTSPLSIALAALAPKTFQTSRHDTCTAPFDPSAAEAVDVAEPDLGWISEEANGPPCVVDVDVDRGRVRPVARHRLHVAAERDDPACAGICAKVAHGDGKAGRRVRERRVVGEGEMCL